MNNKSYFKVIAEFDNGEYVYLGTHLLPHDDAWREMDKCVEVGRRKSVVSMRGLRNDQDGYCDVSDLESFLAVTGG